VDAHNAGERIVLATTAYAACSAHHQIAVLARIPHLSMTVACCAILSEGKEFCPQDGQDSAALSEAEGAKAVFCAQKPKFCPDVQLMR